MGFKKQPDGIITYYDYAAGKYYGMDTLWNIVDSFPIGNAYFDDAHYPDSHELRILPDGGYALLALIRTSLDPSQWAPNIDTTAVIQSSAVQIFDQDKKQIFEWRGADYFKVADAVHQNLLTNTIDFQHSNAIDFDSEGNFILSSRYLSEVTKINGVTGDIMWRLGGVLNQFRLIGDSVWFSYRHATRWLPNGHLTLFDNSNFDSVIGTPEYINHTRTVEYALDTIAKTITLIWQWHHSPETYSSSMGYVERFPNVNTLIGWDGNLPDGLAITEVRPDNSTAFEMSMSDSFYSYRAIKYPSAFSSVSAKSIPAAITGSSIIFEEEAGGIYADIVLQGTGRASLTLFDILGREVCSIPLSEFAGSQKISLPVQNLATGQYYCVLRDASGRQIAGHFAK